MFKIKNNSNSSWQVVQLVTSVQFSSYFVNMDPGKCSRAVVPLQKKLWTGEITKSRNTRILWSLKPIFIAHTLDKFCSKYNKFKVL